MDEGKDKNPLEEHMKFEEYLRKHDSKNWVAHYSARKADEDVEFTKTGDFAEYTTYFKEKNPYMSSETLWSLCYSAARWAKTYGEAVK